jgi:hypothetical protein
VATVVEKPIVEPSLVVAAIIEEGQTVTQGSASQVILEPPSESSVGGEDVVMVPTDDDLAPPLSAGEHDVATSTAHVPSPAAGDESVKGAADLSLSRYVDFPDIGTIDLNTAELPSNDQEMLEVAT